MGIAVSQYKQAQQVEIAGRLYIASVGDWLVTDGNGGQILLTNQAFQSSPWSIAESRAALSIMDYGAPADNRRRADASIAAGSNVVTCTGYAFQQSDVSSYISVDQAGVPLTFQAQINAVDPVAGTATLSLSSPYALSGADVTGVKLAVRSPAGVIRYALDGAISHLTPNVIQSTTAVFAAGDIGSYVDVTGAGVAGTLFGTVQSVAADGSATISASASFTVANATIKWGHDDTQAAIRAITGAIALASILNRGVRIIIPAEQAYTWGQQVPGMPTGLPTWLSIEARGATIVLYQTAPRFLDVGANPDNGGIPVAANYSVAQYHWIEGGQVDVNNTVGEHHVIYGIMQNGHEQPRLNFQHIRILDVETINVLSDYSQLTAHRLNIWIICDLLQPDVNNVTTPRFGTNFYIYDIEVRGIRLWGGNQGVLIAADSRGGAFKVACCLDEIWVDDWIHDTMLLPSGLTGTGPCANVQLGSRGFGRRGRITNGRGINSGDVGIEVDAWENMLVQSVYIEEAIDVGFLAWQFHNVEHPDSQIYTFRDCHYRRTHAVSWHPAHAGLGFLADQNLLDPVGSTGPFTGHGTVQFLDCSFYREGVELQVPSFGAEVLEADDYYKVVVRNLHITIMGINYTTGVTTPKMVVTRCPSGVTQSVEVENIHCYLQGTQSGGTINYTIFQPTATDSTSIIDLKLDGITAANSITGMTAGGMRLTTLGTGSFTPTMRGSIRRLRVLYSADTTYYGVLVWDTGHLSLPTRFLIDDCYLESVNAVSFVATSNGANVRMTNIRTPTSFAAPAAITPPATGVLYTNSDGCDEMVTVAPGTSTISLIQVKVNGITRSDGLIAGQFMLGPGDGIAVTYTGGTPVMNKYPRH